MEFPYRTKLRCGAEAVVYAKTDDEEKPLVGVYKAGDRWWVPISWTNEGIYWLLNGETNETNLDLIL